VIVGKGVRKEMPKKETAGDTFKMPGGNFDQELWKRDVKWSRGPLRS